MPKVVEMFEEIKKYSFNSSRKEDKKNVVDIYEEECLDFEIGCVINYLSELNSYETYMYVGVGKDMIISNLFYKEFNTIEESKNEFESLKRIVEKKDLQYLLDLCKK